MPYEFGPALPDSVIPEMKGGGPLGFDPGEYSDDTAMAVCIAEVARSGVDLTTDGRVGNGALMRTSVVGLTRLDDRQATAAAAGAVASLTHADPLGQESCVLWAEAVRLAVTTGELDLLAGLDPRRREQPRPVAVLNRRGDGVDPRTFGRNGFTVWALQAAWAAITWMSVPQLDPAAGTFPAQHLEHALMSAVRAGDDSDTVAAIAGGPLGARMTEVAYTSAPTTSVVHPHDDGVVLGTYRSPAHGCDAVVSLCRVGVGDAPAEGVLPSDHVEVRLLDSDFPHDNPRLDFLLADTAAVIKQMRDEGKTVFVHCVAAHQRGPSVAVAYARLLGIPIEQAQADVRRALPGSRGHGRVWDAAAEVRGTA